MSRQVRKKTQSGWQPFLGLSLIVLGGFGLWTSLGNAGSQSVPSPEVAPPPQPDPVAEWIDQEGSFDYAAAVNALLGRSVTPQTNAVVLIWQAMGPIPEGTTPLPAEYFQHLGCPPPQKSDEDFIKLFRFATENLRLTLEATRRLEEQFSLLITIPWKAKEAPELAAWLRRNEKALEHLRQAAERPHYFNPAYRLGDDGTTCPLWENLLPQVQALREATLAFALRAMNKLGSGDTPGAWQDLLTAYWLSRLLAQGTWVIEEFVGTGLETQLFKIIKVFLEHSSLTPQQLAECLRQLRALPQADWITHGGWIAEMAAVLDYLQHTAPQNYVEAIQELQKKFLDPTPPPLPRKLEELPITVEGWVILQREIITHYLRWRDYLQQNRNRHYDPAALEALRPDPKVLEELRREIERAIKAWREEEGRDAARAWRLQELAGRYTGMAILSLATRFLPTVLKLHLQRRQYLELLQVAFALELYRCEQGRYPRQLAELAGKYLPEVPPDRFRDQPLIYQVSSEMVLVYSVGPNGKDDAARSRLDDPNDLEADDLVVRWRPRLTP